MLASVPLSVSGFGSIVGKVHSSSSCASRSATLRANEFDVWWEERRIKSIRRTRAAAHEEMMSFDTGSAAGRAARRAALAEAARAKKDRARVERDKAEASGEPSATLPIDDNFFWTSAMLSGDVGEFGWRAPSSSSIGRVLTEFVESDYARTVFNYCRAAGTDYSQIRGMFASVRLRDGTLELTMRQSYENVEGLLDRLALYLRARIPDLIDIRQVHRDGMNIL